ncbi:MAG: FkbM family methyltransferase [Clostridia bacterium]|nr:FkbM family methyltransferase [Clostridia bacterium]
MTFEFKQDVWNYLANTDKPIVMYGTGNGADKLFSAFSHYGIEVKDIFVSDMFYRGQTFRDYNVIRYSDVIEKYEDCIVVLAFAIFRDDMMSFIKEIARRYEVLAPEYPVFGDDYFTYESLNLYEKDIEFVRSILADDISKKVFENLLKYRVTGKIEYAIAAETDREEVFENIIRLGSNEAYVDLGAYRGDTIEEFLELTDYKFDRIYALEPDRKNYKKLCEYIDSLSSDSIDKSRISLVNKASYNCEKVMSFDGGGGRNSSLDCGSDIAHTVAVDDVLMGERASYIKMDVEGAEFETLEGLKSTLKDYRPALAISAYHKTADLFKLPQHILSLNNEYEIYLRHHPYIPAWETNFYCK